MKKYWWLGLVVLALVIPIILNCALSISSNFHVLGDEKHWLSFWGSYGGALIGSFITLIALFKTLSQNEKSNKHTRAQQVSILRAQFRQKWVDDLKPILVRSISYINITKLNNEVTNIINDIDIAEKFFKTEISLCESEPLLLTIHLSTRSIEDNVEDNQSAKYIENFGNIHYKYFAFLEFCLLIIYLKKNSDSIDCVKSSLDWEIKINKNNILTSDEITILKDVLSKPINEFISKLFEIMNKRFEDFNDFYKKKIPELRSEAHDLVIYETNVIQMDIK